MTEQNENIKKLKGKLMWPKLHQPDTTFDHKWTLDLLLDSDGLKEAKKEGLRIKTRDAYKDQFEGFDGSFLRIERPIKTAAGEDRDPPIVKDSKVKTISDEVIIGNGSDAYVRFMVKTRDATGNEMSPAEAQKKYGGYGMFLMGVQVLNLVEYERSSDPDRDFVEEDGFSSQDSSGFNYEEGDEIPFDKTA